MTRLLVLLVVIVLIPSAWMFASAADTLTFFGIQTHFGQGRPDLDSVMNLIQHSGMKAIRDEVYWHEIETTQGVFSFSPAHDAYVNAALARGIKPLIILDYGNSLYAAPPFGTPRDSTSRAAFARYCQAVVGRYAPLGVKHFEIWNEPNLCIPTFCPWDPAPSVAEYVELLKVAYPAIKQIDSTVIVMGCATSPLDEIESSQKIPGDAFIQRVFAQGGGPYMDVVSFHQYPVNKKPEDWIPSECGHVRAAMGGTVKPMWITEIGQHTSSAYGSVSENVQAQLITRTFLVGRVESGLQRISWYDLMDDCSDPANPECRYGLLREDKSQKPAYLAIRTAATIVGDLPVVQNASNTSTGAYCVVFGSAQLPITALWMKSGTATQSAPVPTEFAKIVNMYGQVTAIVQRVGSSVSVSTSEDPLYVVPLTQGAEFKELRIAPEGAIVDTVAESIGFRAFGVTIDGPEIELNFSSVQWKYEGTGATINASGYFVSSEPGQGKVIATYQGRSDTAEIRVVKPWGTYLVSDCSDVSRWRLKKSYVDSNYTTLSTAASPSNDGNPSLRIDYRFTITASISTQRPGVTLEPAVPLYLPGRIDSLQWNVYRGADSCWFFARLGDVYGATSLSLPIGKPNAPDVWKQLSASGRATTGSPSHALQSLNISFYPSAATPIGTVVTGTLYVDNLRGKYNAAGPFTYVETEPVDGNSPGTILQVFPNPFNPSTTLSYSLSTLSSVDFRVFDLLGREVAVLVSGIEEAGVHSVVFNASSLATGLYICRLVVGERQFMQKLMVLR